MKNKLRFANARFGVIAFVAALVVLSILYFSSEKNRIPESDGHYTWLYARSLAYDGRYSPYAYGSNPDFNYKSFRTTNVLRWEYKPGSTLFVVWQQGREGFRPDSQFRFGRDYGDIFTTPSSNTFLVKLSYWLNP